MMIKVSLSIIAGVTSGVVAAILSVGMAYQSLAEHDITQDERDKIHDNQIHSITLIVKQNQLSVATLVAVQKSQISLQNERRLNQKEDMQQIMGLLRQVLE